MGGWWSLQNGHGWLASLCLLGGNWFSLQILFDGNQPYYIPFSMTGLCLLYGFVRLQKRVGIIEIC